MMKKWCIDVNVVDEEGKKNDEDEKKEEAVVELTENEKRLRFNKFDIEFRQIVFSCILEVCKSREKAVL